RSWPRRSWPSRKASSDRSPPACPTASWRRSTATSRPPSARPRATEPSETSKPSSTSSPATCSLIHPSEIATSQNFPGSVQTQVTGINSKGYTVGFYSPTNNGSDSNWGFWNKTAGSYTAVFNPLTTSTPSVNQLLGLNSSGIAVGFYNTSGRVSQGYTYDLTTGVFTPVSDPAAVSLTATAINNADEVAGFFTDSAGTHGFLDKSGVFTTLNDPGFTFGCDPR